METTYITFTLTTKKITWMRTFLTKLSLFKVEDYLIKMNVSEKNNRIKALKDDI